MRPSIVTAERVMPYPFAEADEYETRPPSPLSRVENVEVASFPGEKSSPPPPPPLPAWRTALKPILTSPPPLFLLVRANLSLSSPFRSPTRSLPSLFATPGRSVEVRPLFSPPCWAELRTSRSP